jgi:hypothetical protein
MGVKTKKALPESYADESTSDDISW